MNHLKIKLTQELTNSAEENEFLKTNEQIDDLVNDILNHSASILVSPELDQEGESNIDDTSNSDINTISSYKVAEEKRSLRPRENINYRDARKYKKTL